MISLSSEITDSKGRRARSGWVFFDAQCSFCVSLARRFRPVLEPRGFGLAALQDPRVPDLLGLPLEKLLREMRLLTSDGRQYGGADALIYLAGRIWWAWPMYAAAQLPGAHSVFRAAYRWFASRRSCLNGLCTLKEGISHE